MPVFAEEETVPELVARLETLIGGELHEILIVLSPKSPERTMAICREVAAAHARVKLLVQTQTPGVGFAFRDGIAAATGEWILLMDSDGEMDVEDVPKLMTAMRERGADLVVGSRWMKGGGTEGYDAKKWFLNRGYQTLFRILYRTRIHDLTFGYKLGRARMLKSFDYRAQFQEIGCEVTMRALKAGYRVEEIPTVWRARKQGVSTNPLKRNLRYASFALQILTGK
jgi:dolichol-phosphate mannosyltransferase